MIVSLTVMTVGMTGFVPEDVAYGCQPIGTRRAKSSSCPLDRARPRRFRRSRLLLRCRADGGGVAGPARKSMSPSTSDRRACRVRNRDLRSPRNRLRQLVAPCPRHCRSSDVCLRSVVDPGTKSYCRLIPLTVADLIQQMPELGLFRLQVIAVVVARWHLDWHPLHDP